MEMKQMMAHLVAEVRTNREETSTNQAKEDARKS
jgi:hypothetical protein